LKARTVRQRKKCLFGDRIFSIDREDEHVRNLSSRQEGRSPPIGDYRPSKADPQTRLLLARKYVQPTAAICARNGQVAAFKGKIRTLPNRLAG
jgi:hypothetical protein